MIAELTALTDGLLTAVFVSAAVGVAVKGAHALQRLANVRTAWVHRERIATLAHRIETDPNAPEPVRQIAEFAADHAFDDQFFKSILGDSSLPTPNRVPLAEQVRAKYGDHYAFLVKDILESLVIVCVLSDRRRGARLRRSFTEISESQVSPLRAKIDSMTPLQHAA